MSEAPPFTFLPNEVCRTNLPWLELIDALEAGMERFSDRENGGIDQPTRNMMHVKKHDGFIGMMPCYSRENDIISCKVVCLYPGNSALGLASHIVYVMLFNATDGRLLTIMEGEDVTKRRTSAASALSSRWLAKDGPRSLAVFGAGEQGHSHVQALCALHPNIEKVVIWNHRPASAERLKATLDKEFPNISFEVATDAAEATAAVDLVVTVTMSRTPVLREVRPGTHVMGVGACRPDWAEIDPEVMRSATVYADSFDGAKAESGDVILSGCHVTAELGQVIRSKGVQRKKEEITVYKSLGMAVQDLVAAQMVFDKVGGSGKTDTPFAPWLPRSKVELACRQIRQADVSAEMKTANVKSSSVGLTFRTFLVNDEIVVLEAEPKLKDAEKKDDCLIVTLVFLAKTGALLCILDGTPLKGKPIEEKASVIFFLMTENRLKSSL